MSVMIDRAADVAAEALMVDGNALLPLPDGQERREALLALIAEARESLRLIFYIFAPDAAGTAVRDALREAAGRGVTVSLLVDGFGAASTPDGFFQPLIDGGAHVCRFTPRYGRRYLLRNHQKMAIADGRRAIVGGFNVAEDYFTAPAAGGWCDLGLIVDGPAVAPLAAYFDDLDRWARDPHSRMRTLRAILRAHSAGEGKLRWLFGGPTHRPSPMTLAIKRDIAGARRLELVAAYFSPNWGLLRRIGRIVRRGGTARIIGAAKSDNNATIGAWRHCLRRLLRRGVEIHEYEAGKLHMKLMLADDVAYVGSSNFDMRSLYLNLEVMLRIDDAAATARLRAMFDATLPDCTAITRESHRQRATWLTRLRWTMSYFLVASVDYSVSRGFGISAE